jgi:ubiquinone/menaquinone biosynthesis C-methylase UbiE
MNASDLAQQHWNETPLHYSEEERYSFYPWLYEVAEFRHHGGQKVLEIGCGTGSDLLQFAKHGAHAFGIDITQHHLELAKSRLGDRGDVRFGDGREIPFPDSTFDYVYSHGVIHHSDEPEKIAREIMRILKPGGRFNLHVYSLFSYATLYGTRKFGYFKWKRHHIENSIAPVHVDLYTARRMKRLFPGTKMVFSKHQLPEFPRLEKMFGWYLVAKGQKTYAEKSTRSYLFHVTAMR